MSHQMKIVSFFKASKLLKFEKDTDYEENNSVMDTPIKRSNTNILIPSPLKIPKLEKSDIIDLISDDEESPWDLNNCSPDTTVPYTLEEQTSKTPGITKQFAETKIISIAKNLFPSSSPTNTGDIESSAHQSNSPSTSTPTKSKKYYSPNKKRSITIRSPGKAKKSLNKILSESNEDIDLTEACRGLDDKTIYVIKIIHQCLKNNDLRSLFDENSQNLLKNCMRVEKPGFYLVCKLYWRIKAWYTTEKIDKIFEKSKHSVDLKQLLDSLVENKLLQTNYTNCANVLNFNECFDILKVNEVKAICKEYKIKFTSKEAAKTSLQKFGNQNTIFSFMNGISQNNNQRVLKSLRSKCGECYNLTEHLRKTLDELYILMYLGIDWNILRDKSVELMLFNIKGQKETFPTDDMSSIDNASIVFRDRHEFQSFIAAKTVYDEFLNTSDSLSRRRIVENVYKEYLDIKTVDMRSYISLPVWLRNFTPPYLYIKILADGLPDLKKPPEKEQSCVNAIEILSTLVSQDVFCTHKKPEWYAEMALIYDKCLNNSNKAAEVVLEAFNKLDGRDYEKDCLRARARILTNRVTNRPADRLMMALRGHALREPVEKDVKATHVRGLPMESMNKGKIKFKCRLSDSTVVMEAEEYCKMHYIHHGFTHGEHWEGAMITTMFTLLFWDIIYAELRGVRGIFLTRYQKYPLDLFTNSFYTNRQCLIVERLHIIETQTIDDTISSMKDVWYSRPECELSGIDRKRMSWDKIEAVCKCLGNISIAVICRRLAIDYRYNHSGFPDLTMWNCHTQKVMFVEVKTDSDKPSMKQIQWMRYLQDNNIDTEFCYIGSNTTKCKARNVDS